MYLQSVSAADVLDSIARFITNTNNLAERLQTWPTDSWKRVNEDKETQKKTFKLHIRKNMALTLFEFQEKFVNYTFYKLSQFEKREWILQ